MKTILFLLLSCMGLYASAQESYPPLDSVSVTFPVQVAHAQLAWKLVQDDNVRTAIATAIDTTRDTAAVVNVVLTGMQIVIVHSTITKQPVGIVRPLAEVLENTLLPFLLLPENTALAIAFQATESGILSQREATRRSGERGCREQSATIRRNQ